MKKVLALVIVVVMMMALATVASAAYTEPSELTAAGIIDSGVWPLAAGMYYPELDNRSIPTGAHVFMAYTMDASYAATPIAIPAIAGYTKVDTVGALKAGTYYVDDVNTYIYIYLIESDGSVAAPDPTPTATPDVPDSPGDPEVTAPAVTAEPALPTATPEVIAPAPTAAPEAPAASAYKKPGELASAFDVGKWPLAAGTYDPALDGQGIKSGTFVYGLFDAAYAPVTDPTALAGYTEASSVAALADGQYYVLKGSSGFDYVLVRPAAGAAVNTGDGGLIALVGLFALAAVAVAVILPRKKLEK
ncbi:MAG: hypothetical protein LBN00_04295 [Oscillospiraceae bacterium]|jgi:hypothetical protein|nr:hypothetical protein [Oscillospiraceae bacterium]